AGAAVGTTVLAHALMARRSEFYRPRGAGLAQFFVDHGWRVVAFDFRAHGDSGPSAGEGANVGYDDYVARDLPAVHAFARTRGRRKRPVIVVGHSLGGHVALAAQAAGLVAFDGVVSVAGNVWLRELEPSAARWLIKRASLLAARTIGHRLGWFPARALRLGSDDEPCAFLDDVERFARTGLWGSADGGVDYLSSLARVRVPVLQMVSDGDRIECSPECGARFVAHCGGRHEVLRIARGDDGGPPPDHMGIVTSGRTRSSWVQAEAWMRGCPCSSRTARSTRPNDSSRT
ncbi:MAG TPA: alpha/beta fold hydrolase, partial [Polyangiaceae bacterium]|nr:alpha/beta fold hydrolase [Polyangiaceae bacterium]